MAPSALVLGSAAILPHSILCLVSPSTALKTYHPKHKGENKEALCGLRGLGIWASTCAGAMLIADKEIKNDKARSGLHAILAASCLANGVHLLDAKKNMNAEGPSVDVALVSCLAFSVWHAVSAASLLKGEEKAKAAPAKAVAGKPAAAAANKKK